MLFMLAATLRQSLPLHAGHRGMLAGMMNGFASPLWLVPLIFILPLSVGLMLTGDLPPFPNEALADLTPRIGFWNALAIALLVVIADIWLLITPAMVVLGFRKPEDRRRLYPLIGLNLALGGLFLVTMNYIHAA